MRLYFHCSLILLFSSFIYEVNAKKDKRDELEDAKYDGKLIKKQNYESEEKSNKQYNKRTPKIDLDDEKECKEYEKRGNKENNDSNFDYKRKYTKRDYEKREIEAQHEKEIENCIKSCKKLGKIEDKSDFPNNKSKNRPYDNSKLYKEKNKKNSSNGFEEYGLKNDKKKREIKHKENNDSSEETKTEKGKTKQQNITKKKMNNKSSEEDDSNEDSDESIEYSKKKKKIKYSIKFAHEKAKHGKEVDKTLMRIHRNGKNGHESVEDEDDDEEEVHPKRLQIVDEDDEGF